jgi:hypothetical protein
VKKNKGLEEYLFKKIVDHQNNMNIKRTRPMLMCGIYFNTKDLKKWIQCYHENS